MNVLQIVQANTSTLDTTLPALWYLRQRFPAAKLSILYCTSSRRQVLRDSDFLDEFCRDNDIDQLDLSDFLSLPESGRRLWRWLNDIAPSDALAFRDYMTTPRLWFTSAVRHIGMSYQRRALNFLERLLLERRRFQTLIAPDVVLFDLREKSRFNGREFVFSRLYDVRPLTLLLPHSPHDIRPSSEITHFDEHGESFPDFCRYWIPFRHSEAARALPGRESSFLMLGYPAFDQRWLACQMATRKPRGRKLRCLVMIRNFYAPGVKKPETEWFTVPHDWVVAQVTKIAGALQSLQLDVDVVVKPHPKASRPRVVEMLKSVGILDWTISYESYYAQLRSVDFVISTFTTSLLIPQMCGLPTIVMEDGVQRYVNEWPVLAELYRGLSLYCPEGDDLAGFVRAAIGNYDAADDIRHLRRFFPDGNLDDIASVAAGASA